MAKDEEGQDIWDWIGPAVGAAVGGATANPLLRKLNKMSNRRKVVGRYKKRTGHKGDTARDHMRQDDLDAEFGQSTDDVVDWDHPTNFKRVTRAGIRRPRTTAAVGAATGAAIGSNVSQLRDRNRK